MKLSLPVVDRWTATFQRELNGLIEAAFSKLNEFALVPEGGSAGQSLTKASDRSLDLTWGSGGGSHDEPLTDGASNFVFANGDIVVVTGVPN